MKKFSYLFLSLFAAMSLLLTSCGDDEVDAKKPTITFLTGQDGLISSDATIKLGESFKVKVNGTKGDKDLETLTIKKDGATISVDLITELYNDISKKAITVTNGAYALANSEDEGFTFTITITPNKEETSPYVFMLTDKDGLTSEVSLNITVGSATTVSSAVIKADQKLGAQTAASPGYYSVANGPISSANFEASKASVNFSYGITDMNGSETSVSSKLISISDRSAEGLTKNTTGGITTYFATTTLDYATVTDAQINALTASSTSTIKIEAGKTYAFVSGSSKGLIKVTSITDATDSTKGEATISVKSITTAAKLAAVEK